MRLGSDMDCEGLICECDPREYPESEDEIHGLSFANVCGEAHCYHCEWRGEFPVKPKGLQTWEKKALEAGWSPPAARKKELGI